MTPDRKAFEAWYEADAMPAEADWFIRDPAEPDEYNRPTTHEAWKAWQEAVRQERDAYRELWTAAARVALSNGFDAAYPDNLAALKSMVQATRGRARSEP